MDTCCVGLFHVVLFWHSICFVRCWVLLFIGLGWVNLIRSGSKLCFICLNEVLRFLWFGLFVGLLLFTTFSLRLLAYIMN